MKPWIDKKLIEEIKNKNKLYRKFRKCPTEYNKMIYEHQNNVITTKLRTNN